jgi:hypothetical protein
MDMVCPYHACMFPKSKKELRVTRTMAGGDGIPLHPTLKPMTPRSSRILHLTWLVPVEPLRIGICQGGRTPFPVVCQLDAAAEPIGMKLPEPCLSSINLTNQPGLRSSSTLTTFKCRLRVKAASLRRISENNTVSSRTRVWNPHCFQRDPCVPFTLALVGPVCGAHTISCRTHVAFHCQPQMTNFLCASS